MGKVPPHIKADCKSLVHGIPAGIPPATAYYGPLLFTAAVVFSGAMGNFIDRVFRGYVVDFIYFSLIDFPTFNVADIYVTCGIIALVFLIFFRYKEEDDFDFLKP